jgi:hypothetical protein
LLSVRKSGPPSAGETTTPITAKARTPANVAATVCLLDPLLIDISPLAPDHTRPGAPRQAPLNICLLTFGSRI